MKTESYMFLSGAMMTACYVISLFFLKFWRRTKDRVFAYFSISFALLGLERLILGSFVLPSESQPFVYLIRLLAFILIVVAIVDKNRSKVLISK